MRRIDEMLRELCPQGVEYKPLGEIGYFYGGLTGNSKDDFKGLVLRFERGRKREGERERERGRMSK